MKKQKTNKAETTKNKRVALGESPTQKWLNSNRTRPKTVVLTLQRTAHGYSVEEAAIFKRINQHGSIRIDVDPCAITNDLNAKGIFNF